MLEEVYAQSSLANQPTSLIRTQTPPTCLKESPHVWFVDRHRGEHVRRAIIRLDSGRTNYYTNFYTYPQEVIYNCMQGLPMNNPNWGEKCNQHVAVVAGSTTRSGELSSRKFPPLSTTHRHTTAGTFQPLRPRTSQPSNFATKTYASSFLSAHTLRPC